MAKVGGSRVIAAGGAGVNGFRGHWRYTARSHAPSAKNDEVAFVRR